MKIASKSFLINMALYLVTCLLAGALAIAPLSAQPSDKGFFVVRSDQTPAYTLGTCWALLVGIADYPQVEGFSIQQLKSPVKDVNNLAAFLKSPQSGGCFDDDHLFMLTDSDATRRNILTTFNEIANKAAPEDLVIFYFSGHGAPPTEEDTTYLIPYDHDLRDLETTCINFRDLALKIRRMAANKVILILDACHSGGIKREGERAAASPELHNRYMKEFAKAEGRPLLLSSDEEEVSWEDEKGGIFTQFLLKGLGGEADRSVEGNNDGIVTFEELFHYLEKEVPEYTKKYFARPQKPTRRYASGQVRGDIPLAINWDAHEEFRQKLKNQLDKRSAAILRASLEGLDETLKEFSLQVAKSAHDKALTDEELTKREQLLLTEVDALQSGKITAAEYARRARLIYNMGPIPLADRVEQALQPQPEILLKQEETPPSKIEAPDETSDKASDKVPKKTPTSALKLKITGGLKAGFNLSNYYGDNVDAIFDEYWDPNLGFCGGVFVNFSINDIFAIQPEALFTMKGAQEEHDDWSQKINANYLEIPLLAKLSMRSKIARPNLFLGPAFAIKLSSERVYDSGESDEIDYFKDTDFGLVFGGGVDFDTGQGKIVLEARYTLGLVQLKEEDDSVYDIKNSIISFMAGYSF